MHYIDEGEGEPVVFVHGNPTWSFFYREPVRRWRDRCRCIAVDHIGCGLSDKPQDFSYRLQDHVRNLVSLLESLKLERFSLVVHDWGGPIGLGAALAFPGKVRRIQILNTAAFRSQSIPLRINVCRAPLLGELWIRGCNGFAWPATFMAVRKALPAAVRKGYLWPYRDWQSRIATHRFVADIPLSPDHPSYAELTRIEEGLQYWEKVPMQICWGGRDFCFNDGYYHEWRKRFPGADAHYFKDAGHYLMEDQPEAILPVMEHFLLK